MKKIGIFCALLIITASISIVGTANDDGYSIKMEKTLTNEQKLWEIQKAIEEQNANWTADFNNVFTPDNSYFIEYLGCQDAEIAKDNEPDQETIGLPDSWDWRSVNGTNWITSIKSQSGCGSCVAFGTIGALEAVVQIELGQSFDCDLSEAFLFFCGGRSCNSGWFCDESVTFVKKNGVPDEECFPYEPRDMPCENRANNWKNRLVKVDSKGAAIRETKIKEALITYGPLLASFVVYEDFGSYRSGIYEHVWGKKTGGHAVTIIGYNDDPGYWICKNSWGKNWGENGFFKIKYRECGIDDTAYYFDGIHGNIQPTKPEKLQPYNGKTNVDPKINLSWSECTDFDGDSVSYTIYLTKGRRVKNADILGDNVNNPWFTVENLDKGEYYAWKVVAEDEHGSQHSSEEYLFATRTPLPPIINGTFEGKAKKEYKFTASAGDKDGAQYYWFFNWGDDENSGWIGPYGPNEIVKVSHSWDEKGTYTIKVRYKEDGLMSDWATLEVSMPKYKSDLTILEERYPLLFNLLFSFLC